MYSKIFRIPVIAFFSFFLIFLYFSCGNNKYNFQSEGVSESWYISQDLIEAYYLDFGDTVRRNNEPMDGSLQLKNPIIKINLNKPNDMKKIYAQMDSAIAFANMIGFDNAIFRAVISSFNTPQYSEYEELVEGYLDTAKWINKADAYLRDNQFIGIDTYVFPVPSFVPFKTEIENRQFVENLMNDSVAYLVFYIDRIWESTESARRNYGECKTCHERYPTYGGRKVKVSYWQERQTKPYPRRQ